MNSNNIQPFNENIPPWERGVRKGGTMNRKAMVENLLDFKEVLDKYSVPFVFIFGGLLGLIRQGDFIPYDTDLDVACFNEFTRKDHWKMKEVKKELEEKGFYVVDSNECYLHNDFFIRDGEKIEIWWFDKIDDEWIFGDTVRYPAHYFDKLEEREFLGTKFKVPHNAEEFLERTYGKDWKVPNEKATYLNQNSKAIKKTKVSIILSSFKRPELLDLGLWSLTQQIVTYPLEVIVLNDGLEDDTEKVCNKYSDRLNIRYIFTGGRNSNDKSIFRCPSFALNIGIKQATGDIVILTSPEIYHLNNSIDSTVKPLINNRKIMSSPSNIFIDNVGEVKNYLSNKPTLELPEEIFSSLEMNTSRCEYASKLPFFMGIYKQELIDIGAYDEDFIGYACDDDDLINRLLLNNVNYYYNDAKIIHLYHGKQYNRKTKNQDKDYLYNLKLFKERKAIIVRNKNREWGVL